MLETFESSKFFALSLVLRPIRKPIVFSKSLKFVESYQIRKEVGIFYN